jgi:TRAP transporter TAXI family solute receptor
MRRIIIVTVLVIVGFAFMLPAQGECKAKLQLQMPLGGLTGTYYMIGSPVSKYVNERSNLIMVTPNTSGGGIENVRRVSRGIAHLGICMPVDMFQSWHGTGPHKRKIRNLMAIGVATKLMGCHVASLAKNNIRYIEDLKGRVFAAGQSGSSAAAIMMEFLTHAGLDKEIKIRYIPYKDYSPMLLDGKIDAFNRNGAPPVASVEQVAAQQKIALADLKRMMDKTGFFKKYPYYQPLPIKGGTYRGEDRDITTFGMAGFFFARKDVSEDAVYDFTRLLYSDECIKTVTMAFKGNNLNRKDPLKGNVWPVHPGAAKFWKEIGAPIPEPALK